MRFFVGVTDYDWFRFLAAWPEIDEVNFWQPSGGSEFKALQPGDLFLFKLHSPRNYIAGGGFFATWSSQPVSLAWEAFGEKNGAASFREMRRGWPPIGEFRTTDARTTTLGASCWGSPSSCPRRIGSRRRRTGSGTSFAGRGTTLRAARGGGCGSG